jgi:hypothetical protein
VKKDWVEEAKKRIDIDCRVANAALLTQRAVVSKHVRESYQLSKTQLTKMVYQQDAWLRSKLTMLNTVQIVLERRWLLGKFVWWLCGRFAKRMAKALTMQHVDGTVPIEQREPPKGAECNDRE